MSLKPSFVHKVKTRMSNAYLIEAQDGLILVDAGSPGDEGIIHKAILSIDRGDLRLIFITHAHIDHYGSAARLRQITSAPIAIHQADKEVMARGDTNLGSVRGAGKLVNFLLPVIERFLAPEPTSADVILTDGDDLGEFGLNSFILHTPGHTPGSSSLIVDDCVAFAGDLLSSTGQPHLQRFYAHDWDQLPESLERLDELDLEWIYPGHGARPISGVEMSMLRADE
jgi:glyoxylase-like metal-dependent hydrolase (beta-lactamase superfamily II)